MTTVTLEEAQARLPEIIDNLPPGEEMVITRGDRPVATLKAAPASGTGVRAFGTMKGTILYMAPDFDEIPEGFEEYLP